jgi:hypothetical protein
MTIHHHAHQKDLVSTIEKRFLKEVVQFSTKAVRAPKLITEVLRG